MQHTEGSTQHTEGCADIKFTETLAALSKAVNCVRFSPSGTKGWYLCPVSTSLLSGPQAPLHLYELVDRGTAGDCG